MTLTALLALFSQISLQEDLPRGLLNSLCFVESSYRISVINYDDGKSKSLGVCQIKLDTAEHLGFKGNEKELMRPEINIKWAAKYLKKQIDRYQNDLKKAIGAYNSGTYKTNKRGIPVNSKYINKVMSVWKRNLNNEKI